MNIKSKDIVNGIKTGIAIAVVCGILTKKWPLSIGVGIVAGVAEVVISHFSHRQK